MNHLKSNLSATANNWELNVEDEYYRIDKTTSIPIWSVETSGKVRLLRRFSFFQPLTPFSIPLGL